MSTHNIFCYGEILKIIPKLSQITHFICSAALQVKVTFPIFVEHYIQTYIGYTIIYNCNTDVKKSLLIYVSAQNTLKQFVS